MQRLINKYTKRIEVEGNEPELGEDEEGGMPISSVGIRNRRAPEGSLPVGSAYISSSGDLGNKVDNSILKSIIHAVAEEYTGNESKFFRSIALAVKNAMILASQERNDCRRVAIPFIGSGVFGGASNRKKLARVVIHSAINQSNN